MAGDLRRVFADGLRSARDMLGDDAHDPSALAAAFRDAAPGERGAAELLGMANRDGLLGPVLSACREGRAQGERAARRMAASLCRNHLVDPVASEALAGALVEVFAEGEDIEEGLTAGGADPAADAPTVPTREVSDTQPKPRPVQAPTPVEAATTPVQARRSGGPRVSRRAFVVGGVAVAAAVAGLAYAGVGPATGESESVSVRDSVDGYSWAELSAIADKIAAAGSDEEGLELAKRYHLCADDGTLDGTQLKSFELSDGTRAQAQVVGFRHDDRADGSGKAGITFITKDCVARRPMNEGDTSSGGWEASQMRSWMSSDLLAELPDGLRAAIVPVSKLTNNAGETTDPSSVTATEDTLWLPSRVELAGASWYKSDYDAVYSAEGYEYQLFSDQGVRFGWSNGCLVKWLGEAGAIWWWGRSPSGADSFCYVSTGGGLWDSTARHSYGVAPGFCL